jgi:hypothetical protein
VGDSGAFRYKYVEITAHLLLGDAGKLSFNFLSALDFSILFRKTSELQGRTRVESGGQARLLFYFLGHTGQIINFQIFGGNNIYFQKLPAPPPPPPPMVVPLVHIALK